VEYNPTLRVRIGEKVGEPPGKELEGFQMVIEDGLAFAMNCNTAQAKAALAR